jgi:hypothetical protein
MSTGDAILFLATFALFVVLMLAAIVYVGHLIRKASPHHHEEDDDAKGD